MGTRSSCYIAVRAGFALTDDAARLLDSGSARVLTDDTGTAFVFERNIAPLAQRFAFPAVGGPHVYDLHAEIVLISWLSYLPRDAFRWVRSGEDTDAAGDWFDHPFASDADIAAIEQAFLLHTTPEPAPAAATDALAPNLTATLAQALRELLDAVQYDQDGNAIVYRTNAPLDGVDSEVEPVDRASVALDAYDRASAADPVVRARNDYDEAVARLAAVSTQGAPPQQLIVALRAIAERSQIDTDTLEIALGALSDIRTTARTAIASS